MGVLNGTNTPRTISKTLSRRRPRRTLPGRAADGLKSHAACLSRRIRCRGRNVRVGTYLHYYRYYRRAECGRSQKKQKKKTRAKSGPTPEPRRRGRKGKGENGAARVKTRSRSVYCTFLFVYTRARVCLLLSSLLRFSVLMNVCVASRRCKTGVTRSCRSFGKGTRLVSPCAFIP